MAGFEVFAPLFDKIDQTTATFVTDISSRAISTAAPVLLAGCTLSFLVTGLLIIRGTIETPAFEFLARSLRIGLVLAVAGSGGLYQASIAGALSTLPDSLASSLLSDSASYSGLGSLLDQTMNQALDVMAVALEKATAWSAQSLIWFFVLGIIFFSMVGTLAVGGAFMILTKVALSLLAGLGPLFVLALIWQGTARLFDSWLHQVLNYGLLIVLYSAVFGFTTQMQLTYLQQVSFDGTSNVLWTMAGIVVVSMACLLILLQLPTLSSALAGGAGLGYLWEYRTAVGMGKAGWKGGKAMVKGTAAVVSGGASLAAGGGRLLARGARATGLFRRNASGDQP